jgi:hypothetical protein
MIAHPQLRALAHEKAPRSARGFSLKHYNTIPNLDLPEGEGG